MNAMRHAVWTLALASLACAGGPGRPAAQPGKPDPYPAAYDAGRADAEAELARGNPVLFRVPGQTDAEPAGLDLDTGLPLLTLDPKDPATPGRIAGHNGAVRAYIRTYGLPNGSREPWMSDLLHQRAFFEGRGGASGEPIRLPLDGAAARSPDGRHVLAFRAAPTDPNDRYVLLVRDGLVLPVEPLPVTRFGGKVELRWGEPGADVAYLHWVAPQSPPGQQEGFAALDLRSGRWLRHEGGQGS